MANNDFQNGLIIGASLRGKITTAPQPNVIDYKVTNDDKVIVTYDDNTTKTFVINYDSAGKIVSLTSTDITYTVDELTKLNKADIDLSGVKVKSDRLDRTVTFMADGHPYAISSVTSGQSVYAPSPNPTSESGSFAGWGRALPFTPTEDTVLNAEFANMCSDALYAIFGINKDEYPYLWACTESRYYNRTAIYFGKTWERTNYVDKFTNVKVFTATGKYKTGLSASNFVSYVQSIFRSFIEEDKDVANSFGGDAYIYATDYITSAHPYEGGIFTSLETPYKG